jgi:hypothetical protein
VPDATPRRTRRDLLAGAAGGLAAIAAEAGISRLTRDETGTGAPRSPGDVPYLLGAPSSKLPSGLVRADVRAFKQDSGSDYHGAFADALSAADAIYVPPGVWQTSATVELEANKVLWTDAGFDLSHPSEGGAVIRASGSVEATVRMTGGGASVIGVVVDGADRAEAALEIAADSCTLNRVVATRGGTYALKAIGNTCGIWGGLFQQSGVKGFAMYQEGSDLVMWGSRVKRGRTPLWVAGSGGIFAVLHATGMNQDNGASDSSVHVSGARNQFVDVYYDTSGGPSLLLDQGASGNRFVGMFMRNQFNDPAAPVIRCDASRGQVRDNLFDAFMTDAGEGPGWKYLIELLGPNPGAYRGTVLGSGHANSCQALWNVRPALVGEIASDGLLSRATGSVDVGARTKSISIAHGLKGRPGWVGVDQSRGSAPAPDVTPTDTTIELAWDRAPGAITVYWQAEL